MRDNSPCIVHLGGNKYRCSNLGYTFQTDVLPIRCFCLPGKAEPAAAQIPPGPGTHLSRLIARFQRLLPWWDMQPHKGCGCNDTARWMDQLGADGCETHLDAIVDRLEAEATKREIKFPFRRAAAKRMVRWAIRRARKSI